MIGLSGMLSGPIRQLSSGADKLQYNVYTSASRTVLFGDGSFGASSLLVGQIKTTAQQTTNFYGRIPAGQDVPAGAYSATLVVTLNF
jgi:spore coat protein U-like protein